nr:tetratricopeptide repeat protein [Deltaproteobacteria bacterium]
TQRLVRADGETVERAAELAGRLPSVAVCADAVGLLAVDPLPAEPALRDEIRHLREELAMMPIDARRGEHDRLLGRLGEMAERAREIGYEPLRAEILLAKSRLLYELQDLGGAEEACFGSLVAAEAGHHRELFARALVELIRSSGCSSGVRWTDTLGALVASRLEGDREQEFLDLARLQNMAEAFLHWIEPVRVLEVLAPARERFERFFGADNPAYADYLAVLATAATYLDQVDEPGELFAAARTILEARLGPLHPRLVPVLFGLAELHLRRAEPQAAEAVARSAVDAVALQAGAAPALQVQALVYLGDGLSLLGRTAEGDAAYARAREAARTPGQSRWVAGLVDYREGTQRLRQGRVEEALALGRSSVANYEAALGPDALDVLWSVHLLGEAELAAGRPALARPWFERMRAMIEARSSDTPVLAYPLRGLAECSLLEDRPEPALEPLERALALRRTAPGWYWARPQIAYALARALWATGRERPRAVRLAGEALDGLEAVTRPSERDRLLRDEVRRWLDERFGSDETARPAPPAAGDPETPDPASGPVAASRAGGRRLTAGRARAAGA